MLHPIIFVKVERGTQEYSSLRTRESGIYATALKLPRGDGLIRFAFVDGTWAFLGCHKKRSTLATGRSDDCG